MPSLLMFALQMAGPPDGVPTRRAAERTCPVARPGEEIVVCARSDDRYRLRPLPEPPTEEWLVPKAEIGIAGVGKVAVEAERAADAQGAPINRAMIRLRVLLGRKDR